MSDFDVVAARVVWYFLIPAVSALGVLFVFISHLKFIREYVFVFIYQRLSGNFDQALYKYRRIIFRDLQSFKSLDSRLRNEGIIRILEVGPGSGINFPFYPRNSKLTVVEPNIQFLKEIVLNHRFIHRLRLEKAVLGKCEDMSFVSDNSVDVVVATLVFCSVTDVRACFEEIYRVLAPGGMLLFLEHGYGVRERWRKALQAIVSPIWAFFFGGCHLDRDITATLTRMKIFTNIQTINFVPEKLYKYVLFFIGRYVAGTAQKPLKNILITTKKTDLNAQL
ncbi:hypothetical protein CHUAL_008286 [Chamberlinius hualienensis]